MSGVDVSHAGARQRCTPPCICICIAFQLMSIATLTVSADLIGQAACLLPFFHSIAGPGLTCTLQASNSWSALLQVNVGGRYVGTVHGDLTAESILIRASAISSRTMGDTDITFVGLERAGYAGVSTYACDELKLRATLEDIDPGTVMRPDNDVAQLVAIVKQLCGE